MAMQPDPSRSFNALRKDAGLCCGSRLPKGEVFAYVGRNQNLKHLQEHSLGGRKNEGAFRVKLGHEKILV